MVAEGGVPDSTRQLFQVWDDNSLALRPIDRTDSARKEANEIQADIQAAIDSVRSETHDVLRSLD
jgi:hypothetical protein